MNHPHIKVFNTRMLSAPALFAGLFLTGCAAVGPDYTPPDTSVSQRWHTSLEGGLTAEEINPETLAHWWTTFNDPQLTSLIERAVAGNLDL